MEPLEIFLVIAGVILVTATYLLSEKFELGGNDIDEDISSNAKRITEELVKNEVDRELAEVIDDKIEAASVELDKITNEKILAVGNYSEETLNKIRESHDEVMFLYNMLNEKEATLKDTIRDIEALKLSIKKMTVVNDMSFSTEKKAEKKKETENNKAEGKGNIIVTDAIKRERVLTDAGKNKNEEILIMHNNGSSNMEIAKKLGIGVGEVRLVIDLFKKES